MDRYIELLNIGCTDVSSHRCVVAIPTYTTRFEDNRRASRPRRIDLSRYRSLTTFLSDVECVDTLYHEYRPNNNNDMI